MKTQTVFKIVITDDFRAVIHNKDYSFYQCQDVDELIKKAMDKAKVRYFYGYVNSNKELNLQAVIPPKKDW